VELNELALRLVSHSYVLRETRSLLHKQACFSFRCVVVTCAMPYPNNSPRYCSLMLLCKSWIRYVSMTNRVGCVCDVSDWLRVNDVSQKLRHVIVDDRIFFRIPVLRRNSAFCPGLRPNLVLDEDWRLCAARRQDFLGWQKQIALSDGFCFCLVRSHGEVWLLSAVEGFLSEAETGS